MPPDQGFTAILLIIDSPNTLSQINCDVKRVWRFVSILLHYFGTFVIPQTYLTDQGGNFESFLISSLCKYFSVKKMRT